MMKLLLVGDDFVHYFFSSFPLSLSLFSLFSLFLSLQGLDDAIEFGARQLLLFLAVVVETLEEVETSFVLAHVAAVDWQVVQVSY